VGWRLGGGGGSVVKHVTVYSLFSCPCCIKYTHYIISTLVKPFEMHPMTKQSGNTAGLKKERKEQEKSFKLGEIGR
jgi:hypothetical protein